MDDKSSYARKKAVVEFPEEIACEILLKVPVKSLLKFKTVCKLWNSIISCPRFIKNHLIGVHAKNYHQHKKFLGIRIPFFVDSNCCILYEETLNGNMHARQFDFPYQFPGDESSGEIDIIVSNYCDGLICFNMLTRGILIWNPSLPTEYKIIKPVESVVQYRGLFNTHLVAMGYDSTADDYKIVRIPNFVTYNRSVSSDCFIEVFSMKSNSWKKKKKLSETLAYRVGSRESCKGIYARNRMHWSATRLLNTRGRRILYFDMVEESLGVVNLPSDRCHKLLIYKDSLAVVNNEGLWVLEDYCGMNSSWNQVFGSEIRVPRDYYYNCCFMSNGDFVAQTDIGFLTFDTEDGGGYSKTVIEGDDTSHTDIKDSAYTCTCVESLISPRWWE